MCITYDGSLGDEVIWIANVVLDGQVQSIDGTTTVRSKHIQAEITRSVIRALEWTCVTGNP